MNASTQAEQKAIRNNTRTTSDAVRNAVEKRTLRAPVVIKGIGPGKLVTITPDKFKKLDVDPSYQRGRTAEIGKIVRALQAGGKVVDPATLCYRKGDSNGTLWIVDGYQRVCAHQQLGLPFPAMVHESDGQDAERTLFIAMNERKQVSANVTVKAWDGPSAELLRRAHENEQHSLYQRLNFSQSHNDTRISAASLARSLLSALGVEGTSNTTYILSRVDTALNDRFNRVRADGFLTLVGKVWPSGSPKMIVIRCLAQVAREHWDTTVELPSDKVIVKLRDVNWDVPLIDKYRTLIVERLRRVWK